MRPGIAALLLLFSLSVAGQEKDPDILKRIKEIEGWSSPAGTWEGQYDLELAPQDLLEAMEEAGQSISEIGLKLILRETEALVYIKWEPDGEWDETGHNSHLAPDAVGWHILLEFEGRFFSERWFLTFMRIEEEVANFTITSTVHRWYEIEDGDVPTTYYFFGAGQVSRTATSE